MTQAISDTLNTITESSFKYTDNSVKTAIADFAKILDYKTNNDNSKNRIDNIKTDIKQKFVSQNQDPQTNTKKESVQTNHTAKTTKPTEQNKKTDLTEENKKTIGDFKNQTKIEDAISEAIETTMLENAAESVIDSIIDTEESDTQNNNEKSAKEETNETDNNEETKQTNITEEESAMYKEINTPENPAAIMLLSQIETNIIKTPTSENSDQIEQEIVNTQINDDILELNINKQFENILSSKEQSDIINYSGKDSSGVKTEQPKQNNVLSEKIINELNIEQINSESAQNSSSGDLMQNQTPQEHTVKLMIQGDIKTETNIEVTKTANIKPADISPSKIIEQISKQLDSMYNNSKLNMVLNPGTLGKLHLHLMNTKDGLIAQFTVFAQETKDILMKGINGLKDVLLAHGINIDNISIKVEESDSEYNDDWTEQEGSRGGNKQQGTRKHHQENNKKPFEQMMFEIENDDNLV